MNSPRFPRTPDIHQRPFEEGKNPFRDNEPVSGSDATKNEATKNDTARNDISAYQARIVDDRRPTQPGDYEAMLATRPRPLLILGGIGAALSGLSVVLALLAITSTDWVEGMFYGAPVSLMTLVFSLPAWLMAHVDLKAIRAGAMKSDGRRGTRIAYWLGLLSTMVGFLPAIGSIVAVILSF